MLKRKYFFVVKTRELKESIGIGLSTYCVINYPFFLFGLVKTDNKSDGNNGFSHIRGKKVSKKALNLGINDYLSHKYVHTI